MAVDDVSFSVAEGEIFGILGPNGAGKSTTVECVIGLRTPDAGVIQVMGLNPLVDREELHAIVGVQLQASVLPARLKVGEILELFRSFYQRPADLGEIVDSLDLAEKRNEYYRSLSGGLKQRLSVALALIGNPRVAVLDEMTTGLDPQARRDTWALIEGVRDRGVTIILVTHYMDEAERLCDRVALVDRGRVVAIDTPEGLADRAGVAKRVRFVPSAPFDDGLLTGLPGVRNVEHDGEHVIVTGSGELANAVILALAAAGVTADRPAPRLGQPGGRVRADDRPPHTRGRDREGSPMSTHALPLLARTPRSAFGKLLNTEAKYAWRAPLGLLLGVAVPVLVLVILGLIPGANKSLKSLDGLTLFSVYFPVLIVFALAVLALLSLPTHLASYREQGILRRLSTTPVPRSWMLAAQVIVNLALAVVALAILAVAGMVAFGLGAPRQPGGFTLALVLSVAAMFAIGLWIAATARTQNTAAAVGQLLFIPLLLFSGFYLPRASMPPVLRNIGDWTPTGAAAHALQDAMFGSFPSAQSLLVLTAWAVAFGILAVRFFRWE